MRLLKTLLGALACAVSACGTADSAGYVSKPRIDDDEARIHTSGRFNACPRITSFMMTPNDIRPADSAFILVKASDPDADDDDLEFSWSASSGTFSAPALPETNYICDARGAQVVTVTAVDAQGCSDDLRIDAYCLHQ